MVLLRLMSLFVVLNVVVLAKPNPNSIVQVDDNTKRINYSALYKSTLKFPCKPQLRAFLAKDFLPEGFSLGGAEILKPNNIILHVCDAQSGCCSMANEVCSPITSEKVTFEVQIEDIFSKTKRTVEITHFNHTTCKCGLDSPPKRNNDTYDARIQSLTSPGLTNNPNELLLSVAPLLYFIYLSYSFC